MLAFKTVKFDKPTYLANLLNLQKVHLGMGLRTSDDPLQQEVTRAPSE